MATASFPQYRSHSKNLPEVHSILGRFSAISSPVILAGKGFTVARQGAGAWNVTLNRAIPTNRLVNVQCTTEATADEDIVPKARVISSTVIRFLTYTGATLTDPNAATVFSFRVDFMLVRLPVV